MAIYIYPRRTGVGVVCSVTVVAVIFINILTYIYLSIYLSIYIYTYAYTYIDGHIYIS